jgi:GH24 family phage-related lysozyme (muramidase)
MTVSNQGLQFIINHEGRGKAGHPGEWYQDAKGLWTIGVGHLSADGGASKVLQSELSNLRTPLDDAGIMTVMRWDAKRFEGSIAKKIKVPLSQNQYDALMSFCWHWGYVTNSLADAVNSKLAGAAMKAVWEANHGDLDVTASYHKYHLELREAEYELFTFGNYNHTFGVGYSGDTSGKLTSGNSGSLSILPTGSDSTGFGGFGGSGGYGYFDITSIPDALTTKVTDDPKLQQIIDTQRRNLHMDTLEDLLSMGYSQMRCNGDPEYGEYPSGTDTSANSFGVSPVISPGFVGIPGVLPIPRPQINVDRGDYQKRLGDYFNVESNYKTLKALDGSKFYMTNGERSNHLQSEMIYYMSVLHARIINTITDKQDGKLMICSGFRSLELNSQTDGAATYSAHSGGAACDIYLPSSQKERLYVLDTAYAIGFGGLGLYDTFVHVDLSGRAFWGGYDGPKGV